MEFVKFCTDHLEEIKSVSSCRYMLVDKRIVQKFLQDLPCIELTDDNSKTSSHLLYRSYLYLITPSKDMLVCFRKQWYIKFPTKYAVIRDSQTSEKFVTGVITNLTTEHKYATCFDTRTYSCAQPKLQRKADSKEFMHMIQLCTGEPKAVFDWASTNEVTENSKSWIYQTDRKVMLSKLVSSNILKDLQCSDTLTLSEQQNMYTLPDYFSNKPDKMSDIEMKCQPDAIVNHHPWITDIFRWPQHTNNIIDWISLRCTTKTIAYQQRILVENDDNIDHELLKPVLRKIRSALRTPSFIDKS